MHCMSCGKEIPEGAAFCPGCGTATGQTAPAAASPPPEPAPVRRSVAKQSGSGGCLKLGAAIFLVLVVLAVVGAIIGPQAKKESGGTSTSAEPAQRPLETTAAELFNAYKGNEAAAQSFYGKRPLLVTAVLDKVELDMFDKPDLLLRTPNEFMSAHAELIEAAQPAASSLAPGDRVTLLCQDVSEVMSIPMLKDCEFAEEQARATAKGKAKK